MNAGAEPAGFGWTVNSGDVKTVASNFASTTIVAFVGSPYLDLDGIAAGTLSQAFPTVPGQGYLLTFAYANNLFLLAGATIPAMVPLHLRGRPRCRHGRREPRRRRDEPAGDGAARRDAGHL